MTLLSKFSKTAEDKLSDFSKTLVDKPYVATTNNIKVTVWPEFIDSKSSFIGNLFIWAYHIRIDNKSSESVKLLQRYWRIIDETGVIQEVKGDGILGERPKIPPNSSYQYSSGIHLRYPSGIMTGKYRMQKDNLEFFEIKVPAFSLDVPSVKSVIN
jgi:ApaG protein